MQKKRIASHFYSSRKAGSSLSSEDHINGFLYAQGIYRSKIMPDDLPPYFIKLNRYGTVYLDTKNVRDIKYRPTYSFDNHLFKDDSLYISYTNPITKRESSSHTIVYYDNYDYLLWGWDMVRFICAVKSNSDFDVFPIQKMLCDKFDWYREKNPEDNLGPDIRLYFHQGHCP